MQKDEDINSILNDMIRDGIGLERTCYLAYPIRYPRQIKDLAVSG
jgi:hypothetical protein